MTTPFLTDAEIMDICRPLTQPAAMVRRLRDMGFFVKTRPNGWPLISRANFVDVLSGQTTQTTDQPEPEEADLMSRHCLTDSRRAEQGMTMGRKRKSNPLGLPDRVYFKNGAFWFVHRDNRWERLGTDIGAAKRAGAHYNAKGGEYGTMAYFLDAFLAASEKRVATSQLSPRTLADYQVNVIPLKDFFGRMAPAGIEPNMSPSILTSMQNWDVQCVQTGKRPVFLPASPG